MKTNEFLSISFVVSIFCITSPFAFASDDVAASTEVDAKSPQSLLDGLDENSDEWGIHRTGWELRIRGGIKETTDCSPGSELTVTRMFFLNINGRNPYANVRTSFASPSSGRLSSTISNAQGISPGFTETYSCETVSPR